MNIALNRGQQKPRGAQINPEHPFALGHLLSCHFDGQGTFPLWMAGGIADASNGWNNQGGALFGGPQVHTGLASSRESTLVDPFNAIGTHWSSNTEGWCLPMRTSFGSVNLGETSYLPTSDITVCAVARIMTNTSFNAGRLFSVGSGATIMEAFTPSSSGPGTNTFWRWGGSSSPNEISGNTGIVPSVASRPIRFVFHAGKRGSAVYQDGVKVLEQTTAITRSASTSDLILNAGGAQGLSSVEWNLFHMVDRQWSDEMCRWWSAEPYAHLYPQQTLRRAYFFGGGIVPIEVSVTGFDLAISRGSVVPAVDSAATGLAATSSLGTPAAAIDVTTSGRTLRTARGTIRVEESRPSLGQYHAGRRKRTL